MGRLDEVNLEETLSRKQASGRLSHAQRRRRHHFLWRFAPWLPGWGGMTVFGRTSYGQVLVERVEGFAEARAMIVEEPVATETDL